MKGTLKRAMKPWADRRSRAWVVPIALLVGVGLTLLFLRATALDSQAHHRYHHALWMVHEADGELNRRVLAGRLGLSRSDDAVAEPLRRIDVEMDRVLSPPIYLDADQRQALLRLAQGLDETLERKAALVDRYERALKATVEKGRLPIPSPELDTLPDHGRVVTQRLHRIIREILESPTGDAYRALSERYTAAYTAAERRAAVYRGVLYLAALALTFYLVLLFRGLVRARASLREAHRKLSERYREQRKAERRLRLHATAFNSANEGVILTDAEGVILDVNPSFSRITGYAYDEAVGHTPRMLKSGRHDPAFYAAMRASIARTGGWRGEIWNRNKFGDLFPEQLSISEVRDSRGRLTNYVALFTDISRVKEQERQLEKMAYFDPLTELPNRVLLADRMAQGMSQSRRAGTLMAVCYLDLDDFKPINDGHGHETGDRVLVEIAGRLRRAMRGGDTASRLGGDEFALLLLGMKSREECEVALARIHELITQPIDVRGELFTLSASIGVTLYPEDDSDSDALLRHADQAMYHAKQHEQLRHHLFDPAVERETRSNNSSIRRIEQALEEGELELYYQPKVDLQRRRVVGVEALLRWNHPRRGLVPPLDFLPLIEEHELAVRVGEWVLESALAQLAAWRASGLKLSMSINVAGRQLREPHFVEVLAEALERHPGVPADRLELEVLETAALGEIDKVSKVIEGCRELGVSVALDDFGTGYSSLTYLKRLPASTLKIDQSFVREMLHDAENLAIVQGTLGLATAFQRQAVAEGVESVEHGSLLIRLGCRYAQGYGIARPMPAVNLAEWIGDWRAPREWWAIGDMVWDDADFPLLAIGVEHNQWVSRVVNAVADGSPLPEEAGISHHDCRFGRWYNGHGRSRYGGIEGFDALGEEHVRVHEIARRLQRHHHQGDELRARELVDELEAQRDRVLQLVGGIQNEIAYVRHRRSA